MKNVNIRIGNLKFGKATYIGKPPKFPTYHIDVIERNKHYDEFKKGYFTKVGLDKYRYTGPDKERRDWTCQYDKSCFENEEVAWACAAFEYNPDHEVYELNFFRWHELIASKFDEANINLLPLLLAINASGVFDSENLVPDEVK